MRKSKLLSLILALAMIVSVVPVGAFAAGTEINNAKAVVTNFEPGKTVGDLVCTSQDPEKYTAVIESVSLEVGKPKLPDDHIFTEDTRYLITVKFGVATKGDYFPSSNAKFYVEVNGETGTFGNPKAGKYYKTAKLTSDPIKLTRGKVTLGNFEPGKKVKEITVTCEEPDKYTAELTIKGLTKEDVLKENTLYTVEVLFAGKNGNWFDQTNSTFIINDGKTDYTSAAKSNRNAWANIRTAKITPDTVYINDAEVTVNNFKVGNKISDVTVTSKEPKKYVGKLLISASAGSEALPADTVLEDKLYWVSITFEGADEYHKISAGTEKTLTVNINGEKKVYHPNNSQAQSYHTPASSSSPVVVSTGNVTITPPAAGQKPSYTVVSDEPFKYTAEVLKWTNVETNLEIKNPSDETFEGGKQYRVTIRFEAVSPYELNYENTFKINGHETTWSGDGLKRQYTFTATGTGGGIIEKTYSASVADTTFPNTKIGYSSVDNIAPVVKNTGTGDLTGCTLEIVEDTDNAFALHTLVVNDNISAGSQDDLGKYIKVKSGLSEGTHTAKLKFIASELTSPVYANISITISKHNFDTATWKNDATHHWNPCTDEGFSDVKGNYEPHNENITKNAKASTFTEDGNTGDKVCSVCGRTVKTGKPIPAGKYILESKATMTPDAINNTICANDLVFTSSDPSKYTVKLYSGRVYDITDKSLNTASGDKYPADQNFVSGHKYAIEFIFEAVGSYVYEEKKDGYTSTFKLNDSNTLISASSTLGGSTRRKIELVAGGDSSSIPSVPNSELLYGYNKLTNNEKKAYAVMLDGLEKGKTEIDISAFSLSNDDTKRLITIIRNDNPQLYRLNNNYLLKTSSTTKKVSSYNPSYSTFSFDDAKFNSAVNELLKAANGKTTEYDKAVAIHDALVKHITYEESPNQFNAYGAIADKKAVCEGYAKAYQYLLRELGIQSYIVTGTSKEQNHAWNLVKLDGKYYHVDVTWDDPPAGILELSKPIYHAYFAVSYDDISVDHTITTNEITLDNANERKLYNLSLVEGEPTIEKIAKTFKQNGKKAIAKIYYTGTGDMRSFLYSDANINQISKNSPVKPVKGTGYEIYDCGREWIIEYDADTETEVPHTHNLRLVAGRAPTCKLDGWLDYYECDCGKYFKDAEGKAEIPNLEEWKTGEGKLNKVDHSLGEWQKDETNHWKVCGTCGDKFETANHTYGTWTTVTEPTETTAGLKKHSCSICGYEETEVIPAIGHTHSFGEEWKHDENNHWHECSCGEKSDTAKHTYKWVIDKVATGTEAGSKHEECTVCGYKKANVVIPATDAVYTVKHMKEKLDALETYEVFEEETLTGKIGENTKANAKEYGGFVPQAVTQSKITEDGKTVVEIKYDRKRATFKFKANGGEGTMEDLVFVFGETKKLPANTFTLEGYSFTGWNDASDGSGKLSFADKDETAFNNGGLADNTVITLYAQWEKNVVYYDVTFDLNGGTKGPSFGNHTATVPEGQLIDFAKMPDDFVIAPAGKQLAGLKINGTNYPVTAKYTVTSDTTVKFLWEDKSPVAEKHSINMYDDGDGSAAASLSKAEKDEIVEIKATADSGYKFSHWEVLKGNAKLDNAKSSETYFEMPDENVYIKAHFEKKSSKPAPSGGSHSNSSAREEERDFWKDVIDKIEHASKKETVKADAKDYTKMPWTVMEALKKNPTVTLVIERDGGKAITIPAGKTLPIEGNRVYYQLSYLAEAYKNVDINNNVRPVPGIINPPTGAAI